MTIIPEFGRFRKEDLVFIKKKDTHLVSKTQLYFYILATF
jgi:hypothetical protein